MAIEFNCPHCGVLYKLKDELAGKTGKCKNAKCLQPILIPYRSTVGVNGSGAAQPLDAEALAAAAFGEEKPPPEVAVAAKGPAKKAAVVCSFCDTKFEVDASMAGKNAPCPECGKIVRVPKLIENKPADWRTTASNKPSLAKATEPAPAGVWDAQVKGVSGEALRKAGALDVAEEDDPDDRRIRRIKRALYGAALLGVIALAAIWIRKSFKEGKQERWMERAVVEIDDKNDGSKRPEFKAAIHRYAGEYHVRAAQTAEQFKTALKSFDQALGQLQPEEAFADQPVGEEIPKRKPTPDRDGMLIELGLSMVVAGGDGNDLSDGKRQTWDQTATSIRKCLIKVSRDDEASPAGKLPTDSLELRDRSLRLLARKLAEKNKGELGITVAKGITLPDELPEAAGRLGIELLLVGKKEQAQKVLAKAPPGAQPALTALWLGLNPESSMPKDDFKHVPPPVKDAKEFSRDTVLAYAEGRALQGKWSEALAVARLKPGSFDQADALGRVAAAALDLGSPETAATAIDELVPLAGVRGKDVQRNWALARFAELAARAGKMDAAQKFIDAIEDDSVRAWAKLDVLRVKLAGRPKQKADDSWLESIADPAQASVAQAMAVAEVARHNAAAGESSYTRTVDSLPKGTIRPFGMAGTALGNQDRNGTRCCSGSKRMGTGFESEVPVPILFDPLSLIHRLAADDSAHDFDVLDLQRIDLVRVLGQDDEVGEFSFRDRALDLLFKRGVGAVDGADAQRLIDRDLLILTPDPAPVVLARGHALDGHERLVRPRHVIGSAGHADAVIEKRPMREHGARALLPILGPLVAVIIDVGVEGSGDGADGGNSAQQVGIDEGAVLDARPGVLARVRSID